MLCNALQRCARLAKTGRDLEAEDRRDVVLIPCILTRTGRQKPRNVFHELFSGRLEVEPIIMWRYALRVGSVIKHFARFSL